MMPGDNFPFPDLFTTFPLVNSFTIGPFAMPGKWTLVSAPKKFGWQIHAAVDVNGATVTPMGDPLITAKFKGELWTSVQFGTYQQIRKILNVKPVFSAGPAFSFAYGVDHAELHALGVTSVVLLQVEPAIQSDGGLWTTGIELLQYRKPEPVPPRPKQTIPALSEVTVTASSANELRIEQLRAENQAKAKLGGL